MQKLQQHAGKMNEQLEFVKGSVVAASDIRTHLDKYIDNLYAKKADLKANEAASIKNRQELESLKGRLETELKEVSDVFSGELDEVNGKLATSDRMLSHMQKYLGKVDAELQVRVPPIAYFSVPMNKRASAGSSVFPLGKAFCFFRQWG